MPCHSRVLALEFFGLFCPLLRFALVLVDLVPAIQTRHLLLRALHLGPDAAELEAKILGDASPALTARSLGKNLVESALLSQALVLLHQLLRERQGQGRFTEADPAIP